MDLDKEVDDQVDAMSMALDVLSYTRSAIIKDNVDDGLALDQSLNHIIQTQQGKKELNSFQQGSLNSLIANQQSLNGESSNARFKGWGLV